MEFVRGIGLVIPPAPSLRISVISPSSKKSKRKKSEREKKTTTKRRECVKEKGWRLKGPILDLVKPTKELRGGAIGANESASLLKPSQRSICIYGVEAAQPSSCGHLERRWTSRVVPWPGPASSERSDLKMEMCSNGYYRWSCVWVSKFR